MAKILSGKIVSARVKDELKKRGGRTITAWKTNRTCCCSCWG